MRQYVAFADLCTAYTISLPIQNQLNKKDHESAHYECSSYLWLYSSVFLTGTDALSHGENILA